MATGRPVAKTLIKYNSSCSQKNDEIRKGADRYWVYWSKRRSWNDENAIDFKWSDVKEDEKDTALANFIESLQKQTDEENFLKK